MGLFGLESGAFPTQIWKKWLFYLFFNIPGSYKIYQTSIKILLYLIYP
jgi:hypothetical protein